MATSIIQAFLNTWRKWNTDGDPLSGAHEPDKDEIFTVGSTIQTEIDNIRARLATGFNLGQDLRAASTNPATLANLFNGASYGGVTLVTGDRIGVFGQADQTTNGPRIVQASGEPIRAPDANTGEELLGKFYFIREGTLAGKLYACSAPGPIDLGTTPLPYNLAGDFNTALTRIITAAGLATGGGSLATDITITVAKAILETVLNSSLDSVAVTPKTLDHKIVTDFGARMTDAEFAVVVAADKNGVPLLGVRHDGTTYIQSTGVYTSAYWETAIIDANNVVLAGKPWGESWVNGPFYDSSDSLEDAMVSINGDGNVMAYTDRVVQLTFGEVTPQAVEIMGTDAVYATVSGSNAIKTREDLLARNSLSAGITKIVFIILYGQSLSLGGAAVPAVTLIPPVPGRLVMPNAGVRTLGTAQNSDYATTPLTRANIVEWVDAFEKTDGVGGETPGTGLGVALTDEYDSDTAVLIACHGVGGQSYANIKKGTVPYNNMLMGVRRAYIMAQLLGLEIQVKMHMWHGQADVNAAAGEYKAHLEEFQPDMSGDIQDIIPGHGEVILYISQMSDFTAYNKQFSHVPNDQAAAARDSGGLIVNTGAEYKYPTAADGIHFTPEGSYQSGDSHARADIRFNADTPLPSCFRATAGDRTGNIIIIDCDVPVGPIVRDTSLVTNPAAELAATSPAIVGNMYGFRYVQTGGTARVITDVEPWNSGTQIRVTLSGDPGAPSAEFIYIAMDGVSGNKGGPTTGARACFRDSSPGSNLYGDLTNYIEARILPIT